jgi:hypothetical protein
MRIEWYIVWRVTIGLNRFRPINKFWKKNFDKKNFQNSSKKVSYGKMIITKSCSTTKLRLNMSFSETKSNKKIFEKFQKGPPFGLKIQNRYSGHIYFLDKYFSNVY